MEVNFCRRCGAKVIAEGDGAYLCEHGHHVYVKSSPGAQVALLNEQNELLLTVRGQEPDKGMFDFPGGFCNHGERFEDAAIRELQEELGLTPDQYTPLEFLCEGISRYEYYGELETVQSLTFVARVTGQIEITPGDDVADIEWVPLQDVDFSKFAKYAVNVREAVTKLQEKLL